MLPIASKPDLTYNELLGYKFIEIKKVAKQRSVDIPRFATKAQVIRLILSQKNPNFDKTPEGRHLSICESEGENIPDSVQIEKAASIYYPLRSTWRGPQPLVYETKISENEVSNRSKPPPPPPITVPNYPPPQSSVFEPEPATPEVPKYKPPTCSIFESEPVLPEVPEHRPPLTSVFTSETATPTVPDRKPPVFSIFENVPSESTQVDLLTNSIVFKEDSPGPPPPPIVTPTYRPPNLSVFEPDPSAPNVDFGYKPPKASIFELEPDVPDIPVNRPPIQSVFDEVEPPAPDIPTEHPERVSIFDQAEQKYPSRPDFEPPIPQIIESLPPRTSIFDQKSVSFAESKTSSSSIFNTGKRSLLDMVKLRRSVDEEKSIGRSSADSFPSPPGTIRGLNPMLSAPRNDTERMNKIQSVPREKSTWR